MERSPRSLLRLSLALVFALGLALGCGGDGGGDQGPEPVDRGPQPDDGPPPDLGPMGDDIPAVLRTRDDLGTFIALLQTANLEVVLQSGSWTVFAPTDEAIQTVLDDPEFAFSEGQLLANPALLERMVRYHLLQGAPVESSAITGPGFVDTASTDTLFYNRVGDVVQINGGFEAESPGGGDVTTADLTATTGVVHVIDHLLVPPSIVDLLRYATQSENVQLADLRNGINTVGAEPTYDPAITNVLDFETQPQSTLFAPPDAEFPDSLPATPASRQVVEYHVLPGALAANELPSVAQTVASEQFMDGPDTRNVFLSSLISGDSINGGSVATGGMFGANVDANLRNLRAFNGVVHVIDATLNPLSISEMIVAGDFDSFQMGASFAELNPPDVPSPTDFLSALGGRQLGIVTLFLPTDAAFDAEFPDGLPLVPSVLTDVVGRHVVSGQLPILSFDLPVDTMMRLQTFTGAQLAVDRASDPVTVTAVGGSNLAEITTVDIGTTNGVIHIISQVLDQDG